MSETNIRISLAQIDSRPGDLKHNFKQIAAIITESKNIDLLLFPELCLTGYLCMDRFLNNGFLVEQKKYLERLLNLVPPNLTVLIGFVDFTNQFEPDGSYQKFNAAAVIQNSSINQIIRKTNLANNDIFFEKRYFQSGSQNQLVRISKKTENQYSKVSNSDNSILVGIGICEDFWDEFYPAKVASNLANQGADLLINLSASPFWLRKDCQRDEMLSKKAKSFETPIVYINNIGVYDGYDGQVLFDGASRIFDQTGKKMWQAVDFQEQIFSFEFTKQSPNKLLDEISKGKKSDLKTLESDELVDQLQNQIKLPTSPFKNQTQLAIYSSHTIDLNKMLKGIVLGVSNYFYENGFSKILIGLSGGIDSSLVACLATLAVGKDRVKGIMMPSQFTSQNSLIDSQNLAHKLGIEYNIIPIYKIFETYQNTDLLTDLDEYNLNQNNPLNSKLITGTKMLGSELLSEKLSSTAKENLQARIRGNLLMSLANSESALVLSTSNKTETALGYCTLYGDMCGGLAPILDLDKEQVYQLCHFINSHFGSPIANSILQKAPTAELKPEQTDEVSLGLDYEILVPLVNELILDNFDKASLIKKYGQKTVQKIQKMILQSEFKRRQSAPGIKLNQKSFGMGRRQGF